MVEGFNCRTIAAVFGVLLWFLALSLVRPDSPRGAVCFRIAVSEGASVTSTPSGSTIMFLATINKAKQLFHLSFIGQVRVEELA